MIRATSQPAPAPLPAFCFHWDLETEILAGRVDVPDPPRGFTGAWEVESPSGAVLVLETTGGVLGGVEVVVWPDVERAALTVPHAAPPGRVVLEAPDDRLTGVVAVESPIGAAATASETLIRITFGASAAHSVRIAANVVADLDVEGRLAALWLENLPLFQPEA